MDVVWPKLILHSQVYRGLENSSSEVRKVWKLSELSLYFKFIKLRLGELICIQKEN